MVNMLEKIRKSVNNYILAMRYFKFKLINIFLFDFLYDSKNQFILECNGVRAIYSTKDKHSKHWFFPRYSGKKIHEPIVTKLLINSLNETDTFVDVGTHLGYFTCIAGKILTKGKVYGFEIDKHALNLLKKNIKLNNLTNIEVYNYAVSDKKGYVKIPKIDSPNPELSFSNSSDDQDYLSVRSINLDDFFKKVKGKPNVIKIDVEGAELLVLKGMKNLLEKENLKIFLEIHGRSLYKFNTNSKEIISYLKKRGYFVYEIINHRVNKKDLKENFKKIDEDYLINYNAMFYITRNKKLN